MTEEIPTTPAADEATVPPPYPFAAQIAAIQQLPGEIRTDPLQVQAYIAEVLHETEPTPIAQIADIIATIGSRKALKILVKALKIEEAGGLLIRTRKRRRTLGGVFFFYAQDAMKLKPTLPTTVKPKKSPTPTRTPAAFVWTDRIPLIQEAAKEAGQANIPKLTLMGRPGRIIEKGNVVLTTLPPKPQPKSLPQGLPTLPESPTTPYILYINAKQWRKVKEALANPEDELIIEGYPAFSPQLKAITVFALNTTTKLLEQSRRKK